MKRARLKEQLSEGGEPLPSKKAKTDASTARQSEPLSGTRSLDTAKSESTGAPPASPKEETALFDDEEILKYSVERSLMIKGTKLSAEDTKRYQRILYSWISKAIMKIINSTDDRQPFPLKGYLSKNGINLQIGKQPYVAKMTTAWKNVDPEKATVLVCNFARSFLSHPHLGKYLRPSGQLERWLEVKCV